MRRIFERAGLPDAISLYKLQLLDGSVVELDFAIVEYRVDVEVDGDAHHATRRRRAADNDRASDISDAGWIIRRFTYEQVIVRITQGRRPPARGDRARRKRHLMKETGATRREIASDDISSGGSQDGASVADEEEAAAGVAAAGGDDADLGRRRDLAVAGFAPHLDGGLVEEAVPVQPAGRQLAAVGVEREDAVTRDALRRLR